MNAAVMVNRDESGCYTLPDAMAIENWDDVQANAENVERIENLMGWCEYTGVWLVVVDGCPLIYFVAE